jgi:putative DNA primase/helicase
MDYDTSTSSDTVMNASNVTFLPGCEKPVSQHNQDVPVLGDGLRLPQGFFAEADGIYFYNQDDDENNEGPVRICSPVTVVGLCRRSEGKGWSRVLDVVDADRRTHRLLLDEVLFNGAPAALLRPLHDCGLCVEKGAKARKHVVDLLSVWRPRDTFVRVSKVGWVDDDFDTYVFADGTIVGRKKAILDRDTGIFGEMGGVSGSLNDWKETVAAPCVGNPLMLFAVSQSFVGPMLGPLGLDGGGFNFRGKSSRGKTTLLSLAASVWGAPKFVQSWRTTDNAMENMASCCSSGLLALDELHLVSARCAGDIVYMLANGRGKQRMSTAGMVKPVDTWVVATLSSGEITLEDHLASGGKKIHAGQEVRLIDIEADGQRFGSFDVLHSEKNSGHFVEKILQASTNHHGHASRIFVEKLIASMDRRDNFKNAMSKIMDQAIKGHDLGQDSQVRRVLKRFALAALAGEVATSFGLTGWKKGEAMNGIMMVAGNWIEERDVARAKPIAAVLDLTRIYLTEHLDRFVPCGSSGDLDGWRDDTWIYIRPETWSRIHGAEGALEAARLHNAANMLKTDKGETLQLKMGRSVPGRPKVYAVSAGVLEA